MNQTEILIIVVSTIFAAAIAALVTWMFAKTKLTAGEQASSLLISEKEDSLVGIRTELAELKKSADKERGDAKAEIDQLQTQLRDSIAAQSRLEGAGESLDAIKAQIRDKDQTISGQSERITTLSSDLAKFKTEASEAIQAKSDAIAEKDSQVAKLIEEKERSTAAQIVEIKAACDQQLADKDQHLEEQKRLLAEAEKKLTETFDSLSVKALTAVSEQFMKTAKATLETVQTEAKGDLNLKHQAIEEMLKPVAESMAKLQKQHDELESKRVSAFDAIEKGLLTISKETDQLANALRKPSSRGAWGEMNLKVILDNAGLTEGVHYDLQHSTEDDEGARQRTDVIIHLPNGRDFIIDSKTPLESYWDGMNCEDEAPRLIKFANHAKLVRDHVKSLSTKGYWSRYKAAPDCVVMFIPTEGAYQAAIDADPTLLTEAHKGRIYLANPMTLVNMIHVTAYVLKEDMLKQNAHDVQVAAAELYERLTKFVTKFADLGRNLRISVGKYNEAAGSLDSRLLPQARKLNELGVGAKDELPEVPTLETNPRPLNSPEAVESDGNIAEEESK